MRKKSPFGARSTADEVLAGIDLNGKHIVVTGCNSSLGFETTSALAANGAHVVAVARTLNDAAQLCKEVGYHCSPWACDLSDLESVASIAAALRQLKVSLDAIVATPQSAAEQLGQFALIDDLCGILRDASGRIVMVTATTGDHAAFDSELYAKELSQRMQLRGIAVNSVNAGTFRRRKIDKPSGLAERLALYASAPFMRTSAQAAANIALLAASPVARGITGEYWQNCRIVPDHAPPRDYLLRFSAAKSQLINLSSSALT